jgi:hypothetical protein
VGLSDLIASSEDEYVEIATNLAKDPTRLQQLKSALRDRCTATVWLFPLLPLVTPLTLFPQQSSSTNHYPSERAGKRDSTVHVLYQLNASSAEPVAKIVAAIMPIVVACRLTYICTKQQSRTEHPLSGSRGGISENVAQISRQILQLIQSRQDKGLLQTSCGVCWVVCFWYKGPLTGFRERAYPSTSPQFSRTSLVTT